MEQTTSTPAEDLFRPVTPGRISEEIVEQIKSAIFAGRLGPGDRLPSERELSERFRVSRVTVRDALRVLEAGGLIEIRVGARGGAVVTAPQSAPVGEGITHMLLLSDLQPGEVTAARRILELGSVPLICERADDRDLEELLEICDRADAALAQDTFHMGLSAEFHIRLARCAHNAALQLIVDSMQGPLLTSLLRAAEVAPEMGVQGFREHRAVVETIARRDVEGARRILADHLDRTASRLDAKVADAGEGRAADAG